MTYLTLGEHNWRAAKTAGLGEKATATNTKVALGVLTKNIFHIVTRACARKLAVYFYLHTY